MGYFWDLAGSCSTVLPFSSRWASWGIGSLWIVFNDCSMSNSEWDRVGWFFVGFLRTVRANKNLRGKSGCRWGPWGPWPVKDMVCDPVAERDPPRPARDPPRLSIADSIWRTDPSNSTSLNSFSALQNKQTNKQTNKGYRLSFRIDWDSTTFLLIWRRLAFSTIIRIVERQRILWVLCDSRRNIQRFSEILPQFRFRFFLRNLGDSFRIFKRFESLQQFFKDVQGFSRISRHCSRLFDIFYRFKVT